MAANPQNSVCRTVLDRKPPEVDAASAGLGSESLKHEIGRRTNSNIRLTHRIKLKEPLETVGPDNVAKLVSYETESMTA